MPDSLRRFAAVWDTHWGYETVGGHKRPLHDPRAWSCTLQFLEDFRPHDFFFGGDILDCGAISHHTKGKPRQREGLRLLRDAEECVREVIRPVEALLPKDGRKGFITGNHEDWIEQLLDEEPTLEGILSLKSLLQLQKWDVAPQGHGFRYGKLYLLHGDTVGGGELCARKGVQDYERNVRFGHWHTFQTFTKVSPVEHELPHTGIAVPCLCQKDVGYMGRRPNRWVQGFLYGYMTPTGIFGETVAIIVNGTLVTNGKVYKA